MDEVTKIDRRFALMFARLIKSFAVLSMSIVSALPGCSQPIKWQSATVTWLDSAPKLPAQPAKTVVIRDADQIRRLISFMPGVGKGRESGVGGHWVADLEITLTKEDGTSVTVFSNYDRWVEGPSDWAVNPGFKEFIDSLLPARSQPAG